MPSTFASFRVLQWVLPSGGRVFEKIRASIAWVRTVGGRPQYFARRSMSRSVSNRCAFIDSQDQRYIPQQHTTTDSVDTSH